jgi:uncharacterized phage-associated protein
MAEGYDGREVANFVLDFCQVRGRTVSHLDLQKIVYFCHVWSLIELSRPLIRHKFEAWEFGPVLPYLYREFKSSGRTALAGRATKLDPIDGRHRVVGYSFDPETDSLLRRTVEFYSQLKTGQLVELSHADGGPWHKVWFHGGSVNPGMKIADPEIVRFYSRVNRPFSIQ